jgi:tetratricopeptide (TPR) repeat protein
LATLGRDAALLRDDHPVLARATRAASDLQANELPILERLRPVLEPFSVVLAAPLPDTTLAAAAAVRELDLGDLVTSALLRRVETLAATGQRGELETLLRDALRANPQSVKAHRLLGDLHFVAGRAPNARAAYERALAIDPDDAAANLGLARLLHVQRRFADAIPFYRRGLEQNPTDAEAHNNLAAALAEQGDLDGAARHFEAALRLRPDYVEARTNLTRLQQHLSRRAPAGVTP